MATVEPCEEIGVTGCRYELVRDTPGNRAKIKLLGRPGSTQTVTLHDPRNGKQVPAEMAAEIGTAFDAWRPVVFKPVEPARSKMNAVAEIGNNGDQHELPDHDLRHWEAEVPDGATCRYLRLSPAPDRTAEVELWRQGEPLEIPATSRATALFAPYDKARAVLAWQANISLPSQAQVVGHVGHYAFDMMLRGFDGRIRGAEPELLMGVEPEVTGDVENLAETQLPGQALAVPPVNGLVPPHGPFPTRQPVHRLKSHDGAKSFNVIHGKLV